MHKFHTELGAVYASWGDAETRLARMILRSPDTWAKFARHPRKQSEELGPGYYQKLHDEDRAYQTNNWLEKYAGRISTRNPSTVVEIGTGNGRFAKAIAGVANKVFAVDWARAPGISELPTNVEFLQGDLTGDLSLPLADVVCSADVLEHFDAVALPNVVRKCVASSKRQFHVVACYDDGHSHLTVMPPSAWLALFLEFCDDAELRFLHCRHNNPQRVVCTVVTGGALSR